MVTCQFCNEMSESSIYKLEFETLVLARMFAIEKLSENNLIHHVNIFEDGSVIEKLFQISPST
jgi:hypothetical protein